MLTPVRCGATGLRVTTAALLLLLAACGSSGGDPIDPLAETYCAECSEFISCERVVNEALKAPCPEETRAYYQCVTDNACEPAACESEWEERTICMGESPGAMVADRIISLAPSANLGHRGTGPTRPDHPFPENSIASFVAAMEEGANGIELDVELTMDGEVVVMHDDTVDRTTDCTGCVSAMTLDEVRGCRLLDGAGVATDERPPTLVDVYAAISGDALINIELKLIGPNCASDETEATLLVDKVLSEVIRLGGESRTLFSSFDEAIVERVKTMQPGFYSALVSTVPTEELVERAVQLNQDAIHPISTVSKDVVEAALDAGLQVNVWSANTAEQMQAQIDKGSTGIITDEPGILADLISMEP